ncbi:hypothetical protein SNE40_004925 [Patella caerulea]|uniref:EGF-like domain-containing protein n=1 Tax=Patella caerulea TaxID=87958 RepID=A0AAN8K401_PATCE
MFRSGLSSGLILLCFEFCVGNKLDSIWSSNLDCSTSSPNPCDVLQNICGPSGVCVASGCSYNCMCPDGIVGSNCDSAPPSSSGSGSEPTTSTGTVNEKRLPDIFGNGTLNYLVNLLKVETTSQSTATLVDTTATVLAPSVSGAMRETVSETAAVTNEKTAVVSIPATIVASTDTPNTKDASQPQDHVIGIAAPLIGQILTTTTARPSNIALDTTTKTTSSVPEVANQQQRTAVTTSSGTTPVVTAASATKTPVINERPALITKTVSAVRDNPTPTTISTPNVLQDSKSVQTTTAMPKASVTTEGVRLKSPVQTTTVMPEASVHLKGPVTETSPKAAKVVQVDITADTVGTEQSREPTSLDTKVTTETPLPTATPTTQHKTSADAATSETIASEISTGMPILPKTSHDSTTATPVNTPGVISTGQPSETTIEQAKTTEKGTLRDILTRYPADSQMQSTAKAQLTTPSSTPLVTIESARVQSSRTTIQTNAESTTSNPKEVTDGLIVSGAAATNSKSERNKAKYIPKDNPEIPLTKDNPPSEDPKKEVKAGASLTEVNLFMTTTPPAEIPHGSLASVNKENLLINEKSPPPAVANSDHVKTNTLPRHRPQTNENTLPAANNIDNRAFSKGYMSQDGQVLKDLFQDLPVIPTASLVKSSKVINPKIEASKIFVTPDNPEQLQTVHDAQNINIQSFRNSVTPKTTEQQQTIQGTNHINNESFRTSVTPKTTEQQQTIQGTQHINNESFRTSVTPKTTEQQQTIQGTQHINNESFRTPVTPKTTEQQQKVQSIQNINNDPLRTSVTPKTIEQQQTVQSTQNINNDPLRTSWTPKTIEQQQTVQSTQNINNDPLKTSVTPKTTEQPQTVQSTQNINIVTSEKPVSEQTTDDDSHENDQETVVKTTPTISSSDDDDNGISSFVETFTVPSSTLETTTRNKRKKREAKAVLRYLFRGAFAR